MSTKDSSFITTEEGGRRNMYATEVSLQPIENDKSYPIEAEKSNSRWAMIGLLAAISTYAFTGQIIPGVF
tara:strand:- start:278 stop:487 length:210 start_codon:yes stop_codon:yes gene_type:complete